MIEEKFGYYITNQNNIRIYRVVGEYTTSAYGTPYWKSDMAKVARSHRYTVEWKIAPTIYGNKDKELYNTRAEAEDAARQELRDCLTRAISRAKKEISKLEATLDNMNIKYYDCGGK